MTTMTEPARAERNDIHSPKNIIPADYEYVAQEYMKILEFADCVIVQANRELIKKHMARTGGNYSGHEHGGNCMVCGSVNAIYTVLFYHQKTNSYVRMGQDCAEKCEMGDEHEFSAFRAGIKDALDRRAGKAKAQALLDQKGLTAAWDLYNNPLPSDAKREESIVRDIVGKLVQYGSLSDNQYNFLSKLLRDIAERPAREAAKAAEDAAALPCPTGRVEIVGVILGTKTEDSPFRYGATITKMLVNADQGFKVWGTMPSALIARKGDRVKFTAKVEPSKDDAKFGFFSRPTCAALVE